MITAAAVRQFRPSTIRDKRAFAALQSREYRTYLLGQTSANTGAWIQSVAQDWLVLRLTHSAAAVGLTMALQFLPVLLFGVHGGMLADRLPKRRLLLATQTVNAALVTVLAVLTIRGAVDPVQVYAFALLSGLVFVVDAPARQAFVAEVVPAEQLRAAVSVTAAVFQGTRLVGPAVASVLIGTIGIGWAFAANALCYLGPTIGLLRLRELASPPPPPREPRAVRAALRYVRDRPRVSLTIFLVGVVGTFGLNFPVVLTAMASRTFHGDARTYGLFNIVLAVGSVAGALVAGASGRGRLRLIVLSAAAFGLAQAAAALAPDLLTFVALLAVMGFTNLTFQAIANSSTQLWIDPALRGRVMGLYMLVFVGGTPIGAPIIGAITSAWGPRVGMLICGLVPLVAAVAAVGVQTWPARSS